MEFFKDERNVEDYVEMVEGFDGRELIEILRTHLEPGSTVLEIGMGPGKDLGILTETYDVTGSDYSEVFVERYRAQNADADLMLLDARTLETDRTFDCIYTNKVLMHLSREEMETSLSRQKDLLNEGGILFHSFWKGDKVEVHKGLRFVYYLEPHLEEMFGVDFEVVAMDTYKDLDDDDSIYLVARKKGGPDLLSRV
jgi:SAM-dependent methyltransferase